jgi:hypothetical protein
VSPTAGRVPTVPVHPDLENTGPQTVAHPPVRPPAPAPAAAPTPAAAARPAGVRRARLMVSRVDPWSVLKTSFMLALSFAIILLVATALLWWVLDILGVFDALGRTVNDITGTGTTQFDLKAVVSFGRVMGVTLVLAAFEIVLAAVLATMFAFLYNLVVGITGGLEVTLSEEG